MQEILKHLPIFMMVGIVAIIGISQLNRMIGGLLGGLFWAAVGVVGGFAYDQGGGIGLPGVKFPRELFYAMCLVFAALHTFTAYTAFVRRKRGGRLPEVVEDDE